MDWVFSGLAISYLYVVGRKLWWGWLIALVGQVIYFTWIVMPHSLWGLLPLEITATILYAVNLRAWYREH